MPSTTTQRSTLSWILILLIIIILIILLCLKFCKPSGDDPPPQEPSSVSVYASGWTVKNNADWTPFPPNANPIGAPNDACTGGAIPGSWAHFTFPATSLPPGATVTGIEIRMKYLSASGSNTLQLSRSGTLIGSVKTIASVSGPSNCASTTFTGVGGDGDTWGSGATLADVNGGDIGVRLTQNANTVDLDAVELTVYYTP